MIDPGTMAAGAPAATLEQQIEELRPELRAYAYRMLGSTFEAEDAVQDATVKAWRKADAFEGRSELRTWLYKITTNVCLDHLRSRKRRALPTDLGPAGVADPALLGAPLSETTWVEPMPDARVVPPSQDPAAVAEVRDSVRLALVAALQHLPPKQRAVLILREVLRWQASEVAELLETTPQSVNSALQRARSALAKTPQGRGEALDPEHSALLARYVDAFERYDMDALTSLLVEDATWTMPPFALWLQTHEDIRAWCLGPGIGCQGSRLVPTSANGAPAFGQYKPSPDGGYDAWSIQVLEIEDGAITGICFFLDTERFFPLFGLPLHLDA